MTEIVGWRHRAVETALTLGAVLGVLCVTWAVFAIAFGLTPLVLVSGSMSPAIDVGDLAVARAVPADVVAEGDVVSVRTPEGVRVTHRVVETRSLGGSTSLVLRGDANATPDATPYEVETVDRVLFHVPYAGRVVAAASTRGGTLLVAGLVAGLLVLGFGGSERRRPPGGRRRAAPAGAASVRRRSTGRGLLLGAVVVGTVVTGVSVVPGPTPTTAYFTDVDTFVDSGLLTASSMMAPTITCSGGGLLTSPTISWPVPQTPSPVQYEVTYVRGGTTQTATTTGTTWQLPSGGISLGATYTITVKSQRAAWSSAASNSRTIVVTSILLGLSATCGS